MPPVGGLHKNAGGLALIKEWIQSLEGTPALEAVEISASAGHRDRQSVMVELRHGDPEAELHYTTTDTPPDRNSTRYEGPFLVTRPAVVRAIAYKQGMRWSRPSSLELFYLGSQSQAPAPARRPGGR